MAATCYTGKGAQGEISRRQKSEKMCAKHAKSGYFCHFYASIVKFGLILTHLFLYFGVQLGDEICMGANAPMPPWH